MSIDWFPGIMKRGVTRGKAKRISSVCICVRLHIYIYICQRDRERGINDESTLAGYAIVRLISDTSMHGGSARIESLVRADRESRTSPTAIASSLGLR